MRFCKVCGHPTARTFQVREMMFGYRDRFEYAECGACKSVQIVEDLPSGALSKYYPAEYYSFKAPPAERFIKRWLKRERDRHASGQPNLFGAILSRAKPNTPLELLHRHGVRPDHRILDVGCGAGGWLRSLAAAGFSKLTGVDPFVEKDIAYPDGVVVTKADISALEGAFDVITFHHALEHVPEPAATLKAAASRLAPGGLCMVRIPTVSSFAWEEYGTDWVQLDPPRHLCIPTREGVSIMAREAGFSIEAVVDDSDEFQFYGSEQYRRDIPLHDPRSYSVAPENSVFSPEEIRAFRERALALNARSRGDQAAFLLRREPA